MQILGASAYVQMRTNVFRRTCRRVTACRSHPPCILVALKRPILLHAFDVRNALFLVRLEECEGEFPLGLAVRTFDSREDDSPMARFKSAGISESRQLICGRQSRSWFAIIAISSIIPIPVVLTPRSIGTPAEPVLTRDCMSFVRSHMEALAKSGEWGCGKVGEEDQDGAEDTSENEEKGDNGKEEDAHTAAPITVDPKPPAYAERKRRRSSRSSAGDS
eukprot:5637186-Pleurochrysis_carterae.AAC.1